MRRRAAARVGLVLALGLAAGGCGTGAGPGAEAPEAAPAAPAPDELVLPPLGRGVERPDAVLLVAVSGLTADAWSGEAPAMPVLARLARAGAAAPRLVPVAPASHSPALATLVSGRRPASHGVVAERRLADAGVVAEGFFRAEDLDGPTLWSAAAAAGRSAAALGWPTTLDGAIPLLVPDVGLVPRGRGWLDVLADRATPALVEALRGLGAGSAETAIPGRARDAALADLACALLRTPAPPALVLLALDAPRGELARFGPGTLGAHAALAAADGQLEALLRCLQEGGRLARVAVMVTGDHGLVSVHSALAPNAVLADAGLLEPAGDGPRLRAWRAVARSNGGSAFVYARDAADALAARRALEAEARARGVFRVVSAEELLDAGADPQAWFGLEARPGFAFVDVAGGPVVAPSALGGAGGYLPALEAMAPGWVAWGRGIREETRIPWMRQIDVAPTVAELLGLPLEGAEGAPLTGALRVPEVRIPPATPAPGAAGGARDAGDDER